MYLLQPPIRERLKTETFWQLAGKTQLKASDLKPKALGGVQVAVFDTGPTWPLQQAPSFREALETQ